MISNYYNNIIKINHIEWWSNNYEIIKINNIELCLIINIIVYIIYCNINIIYGFNKYYMINFNTRPM